MNDCIIRILSEIHPEYDYANSSDFIQDGLLDSYDMMILISEIENEFGVLVDPLDIVPEYFKSIDTLCELINNSDKNE